MIADMLINKQLNPIVMEFFNIGKKLNISPVFIRQSYFAVPKNITLNLTHHFFLTIPSKWKLQNFINLYKKSTAKPHSFLVINTTLTSDNHSRFRKNLLERI